MNNIDYIKESVLDDFHKSPEFKETGLRRIKSRIKVLDEFGNIVKYFLNHHFDFRISNFGEFGSTLLDIRSEVYYINQSFLHTDIDYSDGHSSRKFRYHSPDSFKIMADIHMLSILEILVNIYSNRVKYGCNTRIGYENKISNNIKMIRVIFEIYKKNYGVYFVPSVFEPYVSFFISKDLYFIEYD